MIYTTPGRTLGSHVYHWETKRDYIWLALLAFGSILLSDLLRRDVSL